MSERDNSRKGGRYAPSENQSTVYGVHPDSLSSPHYVQNPPRDEFCWDGVDHPRSESEMRALAEIQARDLRRARRRLAQDREDPPPEEDVPPLGYA